MQEMVPLCDTGHTRVQDTHHSAEEDNGSLVRQGVGFAYNNVAVPCLPEPHLGVTFPASAASFYCTTMILCDALQTSEAYNLLTRDLLINYYYMISTGLAKL